MKVDKVSKPAANDGRNIDQSIAELSGEAGAQAINLAEQPTAERKGVWHESPNLSANDPTYYDVPLLQRPVWEWAIPLYYFVGGVAGGSLAFGAAAQFGGSEESLTTASRCRWTGMIGASVSAVLLIYDLGRPLRFFNMLRVFRPTSPMNMGAWILSGTVPPAFLAEMLARRRGLLGVLGRSSTIVSGLFGLGLATYTGVLVTNSVIPIWSESRQILPILFSASSMASAASVFDLSGGQQQYQPFRWFGIVGSVGELLGSFLLEKRVSVVPRVALPLKKGKSGLLWKASVWLTGSSLAVRLLPIKPQRKRVLSATLACLGSFCMRYGIHEAGTPSAEDPRASFYLQRS